MQGLDGDAGILGAVFEEIDFPAGLEGYVEGGEHLDGVGEFVVGIDHERGVEGVGRELDVIDDSEVGLDVGDLAFGGFGFQEIEHLLLDVHGDDFSARHERRDAERIVAGARADVGDDRFGREIEKGNGTGGGFLHFALVALQPIEPLMAHHMGDLASHENFSDAVRRWGRGGVAGCFHECRRGESRGSWQFAFLVVDDGERDQQRQQDDGGEDQVA